MSASSTGPSVTTVAPPPPRSSSSSSSSSLRVLQLLGPFLGLALVILTFRLFGPPEFLSWYNAKNIARRR
jgi:hypothetical protein